MSYELRVLAEESKEQLSKSDQKILMTNLDVDGWTADHLVQQCEDHYDISHQALINVCASFARELGCEEWLGRDGQVWFGVKDVS